MDARLWPTLADAVSMLESRGIACAVIGGLAVSLGGQPRMTVDVDLVIAADVDDTLRLSCELPDTKVEPLFSGVKDVVSTALILPMRYQSTGVGVDLAIGMSGFERGAIERAGPLAVGDTSASPRSAWQAFRTAPYGLRVPPGEHLIPAHGHLAAGLVHVVVG